MIINLHLSKTSLTTNGIYSMAKSQKLANWINKVETIYLLPPRSRTHQKIQFQINGPWIKAAVPLLISNTIDFKLKLVRQGNHID